MNEICVNNCVNACVCLLVSSSLMSNDTVHHIHDMHIFKIVESQNFSNDSNP